MFTDFVFVCFLVTMQLFHLLTVPYQCRLWKHVIRKGDTVVDATCGNGNDTLAMANMVKDELGKGCVYGMDIQKDAIKNTSFLLDVSLNPIEVRLSHNDCPAFSSCVH